MPVRVPRYNLLSSERIFMKFGIGSYIKFFFLEIYQIWMKTCTRFCARRVKCTCEPLLRSLQFISYLRNSLYFIKPEGSLPCSLCSLLAPILSQINTVQALPYYYFKISGVPRGDFGGSNPPPPKFRRPSKIVPNSTRFWKLLKMSEFKTPTPQDVRKKGSKILKLPPVRNCFTSAMTNKLVVIINSLKVPKIKKILLYEMKFLVQNYSCLHNPWLGGYRLQIPVFSVLCPQLNLVTPPRTKFLGTPLDLSILNPWTSITKWKLFQTVFCLRLNDLWDKSDILLRIFEMR